jgi:HAE1 family hydrophobic/amphiphilic exporter-1
MDLSLQEALATAMQKSFDIQVQRVALQGSDATLAGSYGIYDPALSADWSASVYRQPLGSYVQTGTGTFASWSRQDILNFGLSQYSPWGQTFSVSWNNTRGRSPFVYSLFDGSSLSPNPTYGSGLQLQTTLPLLQGFGMKVGNRTVLMAKWDRTAAGEQFAYQLRDTLVQVESDYWNLIYTVKDLEVKLKALDLAKRFQEETRLKIQAGVLAPIEQISSDAQVANREQEIILAQTQVGNAEDILKLELGFTKDSPEWGKHVRPTQEPRDVNPSDYSEETLIGKALEIRPELKQLVAQVEKAKLGTLVAKNATLPQLNLVGGIGYNGLAGDAIINAGSADTPRLVSVNQSFSNAWDQITGFDYKSWSVGLSLRYPIGNRAARYAYQGAKLQQTSTEILFEKKKLVVANEVRYTLRNLEAAHKRVAAAKVNLDLQRQKLDAEEKKFQNGLSTSFQVLSYQNDLLNAATVLLRAYLDREIAYANLDRAVGTYLENRGFKEIN